MGFQISLSAEKGTFFSFSDLEFWPMTFI